MDREQYKIAKLNPDQLEEIKQTEQHLSELIGQTISLVAYQTDADSIQHASE